MIAKMRLALDDGDFSPIPDGGSQRQAGNATTDDDNFLGGFDCIRQS